MSEKRMIYIVEHPDHTFTGFRGLDYHNGTASTSSAADAWKATRVFGCIIRDQEGKQIFIRRSIGKGGNDVFTLHDSPVEDVPRPAMPAPEYANRKDRRHREKTERRFRERP